jgi:arginyl-tRNA synthetase
MSWAIPGDISSPALAAADLGLLQNEGEMALIKLTAEFPRIVEAAALSDEPHRIAFYLHDLASSLHAHWTRGKDRPQLRFLNEKRTDLTAQAGLITALATVLASGRTWGWAPGIAVGLLPLRRR